MNEIDPTVAIALSTSIMTVVGMIVSAVFLYFPWLNKQFALLIPDIQRLIMIGVLLIVSIVVVLVSCYDLWVIVPCTKAGILNVVFAFGWSLVGNQTVYPILPKPGVVKQALSARGLPRG